MRECQYIEGDVAPGTIAEVCGKRALPGKSYCKKHQALCYVTPPPFIGAPPSKKRGLKMVGMGTARRAKFRKLAWG